MAGRIRQLCGLIDYEPFEAALANPNGTPLGMAAVV
jgi:hypothetical protein